ncbi:DUF397 domain-containing protein [Murinocardiopsis flavida]|uniref:DUF397 domain-containing protein n=1 Tax=Murinocardiopsis flavida TaxID=645275 RepID=UPI000D0DDD12|nr:DUF397 domain-containing protein [Murinocardiopsis flavida]
MITSNWQKSSYSQGGDTNCVEVRSLPSQEIDVRDTQNRDSGHLLVSSAEWTALLRGVRSGDL